MINTRIEILARIVVFRSLTTSQSDNRYPRHSHGARTSSHLWTSPYDFRRERRLPQICRRLLRRNGSLEPAWPRVSFDLTRDRVFQRVITAKGRWFVARQPLVGLRHVFTLLSPASNLAFHFTASLCNAVTCSNRESS